MFNKKSIWVFTLMIGFIVAMLGTAQATAMKNVPFADPVVILGETADGRFLPITAGSSTEQTRIEYNVDGTVLYLGTAARGEADSDATWTIQKFTYDVNGQITLIQTAVSVAWTGRGAATYE